MKILHRTIWWHKVWIRRFWAAHRMEMGWRSNHRRLITVFIMVSSWLVKFSENFLEFPFFNFLPDQSTIPIVQSTGPLVAASKMMPVPESLMSPDCGPAPIIQQRSIGVSSLTTSTTNHTTVTQTTVKTIRNKGNLGYSQALQIRQKKIWLKIYLKIYRNF